MFGSYYPIRTDMKLARYRMAEVFSFHHTGMLSELPQIGNALAEHEMLFDRGHVS